MPKINFYRTHIGFSWGKLFIWLVWDPLCWRFVFRGANHPSLSWRPLSRWVICLGVLQIIWWK